MKRLLCSEISSSLRFEKDCFRAMDFMPHSSGLQEASPLHPIQNLGSTVPPPVIVMVPTPAPVRETVPYAQRFPKTLMLTFSSVQLGMAFLAIITETIGSGRFNFLGTGIWCGTLFVLSGVFGMVASRKPTFGWIVTFMVFSIISASFCLPLLVISSIGASHYYHRGKYAEHAVSAMQIIISLIQAAVTITSAGMACRAVCCGPRRESRLVYYNVSGGSNANNAIYQHITMPDQPRGYITIPMRQVQDVFASATATPHPNQMACTSSSVMITKVHKSPLRRPTEPPPPAPNISRIGSQVQAVATPAGSTAFPTMSIIPSTAETNISRNSLPPKYEDVARMENDNESNYQQFRFQ